MTHRLAARRLQCYAVCPGLFMSQLTYALLPYWTWMLLIPIFCLARACVAPPHSARQLRVFSSIMTITPYNAAEALVALQRAGVWTVAVVRAGAHACRPRPGPRPQANEHGDALRPVPRCSVDRSMTHDRRRVRTGPLPGTLDTALQLYAQLDALAAPFRTKPAHT